MQNQAPPLDHQVLHHILQHTQDAVLVVTASDLKMIEINRKACELIGRSRDELIGQELLTIECALQDIFFWEELKDAPRFEKERIAESEWLTAYGYTLPIEKRVSCCHFGERTYWIIHVLDLRSRRQSVEEQIQLASQLQSSLEATAEGILSLDTEGRIINLNRRFAAMWDLEDDMIASRDGRNLMMHILGTLKFPDSFAQQLEALSADAEMESEENLSLQDGRHYVCVSKPEYLRDRVVGRVFSVRDITAMKTIENDLVNALVLAERAVQEKTKTLNALKLSESKLRRLINSSLIGIFQGDMHGHLIEANAALINIIGGERDEIIGQHVEWLNMTCQTYHSAHQTALKELFEQGHTLPFEAEFKRKDGSVVPVMVGLTQLEGSRFEWVGFVLDLTEQKKADRAKSEFISVVSHELRTPLTSIRGALGLLDSGSLGDLSPQLKQLVQIAHRNSQRLSSLVNDLLDMEKLSSDKMNFQIKSMDLFQVAQAAIEAHGSYAAQLGVCFKMASEVSAFWVMADQERVMQVFANLLSNAAKYSPKGEAVVLRFERHERNIQVEIEDKGAGIPLEFRERIFSKFAQADGSDTRQQGGTGLGLHISKTFVEKMGGRIGFKSEVGQGSVFWFQLPVSESECS